MTCHRGSDTLISPSGVREGGDPTAARRPGGSFVEPFVDAIDRPPHTCARARPRAAPCGDTAMTAGITLTDTANGTTAEHELAALQREHGRPLFALLLRLSDGDRQRAEDLVQETLVRLAAPRGPARRRLRLSTAVAAHRGPAARHRRAPRPPGAPPGVATPYWRTPASARYRAERAAAALDVREAVKTLTPGAP
ncbi:hypothetical protein SVIOM342S_03013 [Streptomyces violaceorubidus]